MLHRKFFALLLLAALLLLPAGCGERSVEEKEEDAEPLLPESTSFDGSWIPLSQNASQNAMEIRDGKVTWYVLRADGSGFEPMEAYRKRLLAENDEIASADFTAELLGNALSMVLTVTDRDGRVQSDPVIGTLSLSGDVLTLTLAGGLAGGSANKVEFTRSAVPVAEYRPDLASPSVSPD